MKCHKICERSVGFQRKSLNVGPADRTIDSSKNSRRIPYGMYVLAVSFRVAVDFGLQADNSATLPQNHPIGTVLNVAFRDQMALCNRGMQVS